MWEVQESQIWYQEGIVPGRVHPGPCCLSSSYQGLYLAVCNLST